MELEINVLDGSNLEYSLLDLKAWYLILPKVPPKLPKIRFLGVTKVIETQKMSINSRIRKIFWFNRMSEKAKVI